MKRRPAICVQLIHIAGPLKGEIQEFSEDVITIGRDPSCHLRFPPDLTCVSRKHAGIKREGNQFKLIDHSTNGTYVNGKRINEVHLKKGDVLEFSTGGPKVSFLTEMKELGEESAHVISTPPPSRRREAREISRSHLTKEPPISGPDPETPGEISPQKVSVPLVIQYGLTLRSFKELPVTIGKNRTNEFVLDHPAIHDKHAQIFFGKNDYWIKDLTGGRAILLNRQPIASHAPLKEDDVVSMSQKGPAFRFLGGGRLVEVTEPPADQESPAHDEKSEVAGEDKKPGGILSKFKKHRTP